MTETKTTSNVRSLRVIRHKRLTTFLATVSIDGSSPTHYSLLATDLMAAHKKAWSRYGKEAVRAVKPVFVTDLI
jgi:hypothetical protein